MRRIFLTLFIVASVAVWTPAEDVKDLEKEYLAQCSTLMGELIKPGYEWIVGKDGWVVGWTELVYLTTPKFWGPDAKAANPFGGETGADPLVAIVDFNQKLAARGIELIMVPVPTRPLIYPESVLGKEKLAGFAKTPHLNSSQKEFFKLLKTQGVNVLELTPIFLARRIDPHAPLFMRSDTHWTGLGLTIAAGEIAKIVKTRPWFSAVPQEKFVAEWEQYTILGHIFQALLDEIQPGAPARPPEPIWLRKVTRSTPAGPVGIAARQPASQIVLIGDSNVDCWSGYNSSLSQQLAFELGTVVDRLSTSGGGATTARLTLVRHATSDPGYLANKKLVIWVFTSRNLVRAYDGWHKLDLPNSFAPAPKPTTGGTK